MTAIVLLAQDLHLWILRLRSSTLSLQESIVSALRVTSDPTWDSHAELHAAIALAYEQVQTARRCLAVLAPPHDLSAFLQSAEAELVRAMVAVGQIEQRPFAPRASERPILITKHQSALPRTA
jgi:hypothetical protein